MSDRVNLVAPASPVHRARLGTVQTGTGKVTGSEIKMYYGCPCNTTKINRYELKRSKKAGK